MPDYQKSGLTGWRFRFHEIIFEADTLAGKAFDVVLILAIGLSTLTVMLESVSVIRTEYGIYLRIIEWVFTVLFTVEFLLRMVCVIHPSRYVFSFFGMVDLLAVLPTYLSLVLPGSHYLLVIRFIRILRVFRVMKLSLYLKESEIIIRALKSSGRKIAVFLFAISNLVVILGSLMYLIEGEAHGFTSIPRGIYWAIVTLTTVGYGDIAPQTNLGQILAAIVMILGYAIIAVPTGIVSAEMIKDSKKTVSTQVCHYCSREGHDPEAEYCKYCGEKL